ncbi:MAG: calcium/sodium antiporter [Rhodospirillaceae bacterium]|jgi:cation:H+ antiporter|nr:calcium/sodium antiporter [Rhodospirillaceae bacterium]
MMYLQVAIGLVVLVGGAELLVRGAVMLAERYGVSPMVIGMTVVAVGTSAPELVVSVRAALEGAPGLAVGNVVGSNIANVLLILGVAALIMPIKPSEAGLRRDGAMLVGGTLLFMALAARGELGTFAGILLLIGFFVFLAISYWRDKGGNGDAAESLEEFEGWPKSALGSAIAVIVGLAGLIGGAEVLINGGVEIARSWGVSEEVIGLTLFAFGTSLPELAATVVAAWRGHAAVGLGNVLGSNLFNILGVAGTTALVAPLPISAQVISFDMWVMLASTLILVPVLAIGWRISRFTGGVLFAVYIGYIWLQAHGVERVLG